jgi:hypothetical protein
MCLCDHTKRVARASRMHKLSAMPEPVPCMDGLQHGSKILCSYNNVLAFLLSSFPPSRLPPHQFVVMTGSSIAMASICGRPQPSPWVGITKASTALQQTHSWRVRAARAGRPRCSCWQVGRCRSHVGGALQPETISCNQRSCHTHHRSAVRSST